MSVSATKPRVRKNSALTTVRVDGPADLTTRKAGDLARRAIEGVKLRRTQNLANGNVRRLYK